MKLLAIDPGRDTGWAYFDSELVGCGLVHPETFATLPRVAGRPDVVLIEKPKAYPGQPVPPDDLITLATRAGEIAGLFPSAVIQYVFPRDWKGQVPKEICHRRAKAKLSKQELWVAKVKNHNIWDAIALGLWRLGR